MENPIERKLIEAVYEVNSETVKELDDWTLDVVKMLAIRHQIYYLATILRDEKCSREEKKES